MKAVLLMAGKGTRMAKYYEGPKQLLPVAGKPIVERILDQLPDEVDDLIFVVGGPHEAKLREYFTSGEYQGRKVTFVRQAEQLGVAHAFWQAEGMTAGRWVGILPDDVYGVNPFEKLLQHELSILAHRVPNPEAFGVLVADKEGNLVRSVEKPKEFVSDLVWTGLMVMDDRFFEAKVEPSARGEYESPDVWMKLAKDYGAKIKVVEAEQWLPVNDKPQLEEAERVLKNLST
ncbi:MAG: nucleotidyltransferase family protein [Patescibacteria group bacterium]